MKSEEFAGGRRDFLKRLGITGASLLVGSRLGWSGEPVAVPLRQFGRHEIEVSTLCIGGHTLRVADDAEAARIVDFALESGVNFFDNSWDYHGGRAEELMGRLLAGRRDRVFLMTKVCTHDTGNRDSALKMLDESLRRLKTDYLDLWQVHAVATEEQVRRAFAPGGVMGALDIARRQGKVRYVGFTGHTDPDVHLAMLSHGYAFDACQLPISPIEANSNAFVRRVLPVLIRQKIAPLAMKTLGGNARPIHDGVLSVSEALSYALSLPICTVVTGVQSVAQLRKNAALASGVRLLSEAERIALEKRCLDATESGKYQPYRRWMAYRDGDAARYV